MNSAVKPMPLSTHAAVEIQRVVQDAGYMPNRIKHEGRWWFVYLPTDNRLTKAVLDRRFKRTPLEPVSFGWERQTGFYAVFEMRGAS